MLKQIIESVKKIEPELIKQRRDFHRYAEVGWTEYRTASIVAQRLSDLGYELQIGEQVLALDSRMGLPSHSVLEQQAQRALQQGADAKWVAKFAEGCTAMVAILKISEGPVLAYRFDMDANDVQETDSSKHLPNQLNFASINSGAMHACGHDGHSAMGMTLAKILIGMKNQLSGTIKLIFQPAEEGCRGAKAIADSGILDDVDYFIGVHLGLNAGPVGNLVCQTTGFLATSKIDASFLGVPAHAGIEPEKGKNALLAACNATLNLQAISRNGKGTSRINVGYLQAGTGRNVIAPNAIIKLETRGATTEINEMMKSRAITILQAAAQMHEVEVEINEVGGASGIEKNPQFRDRIQKVAQQLNLFTNIIAEVDAGASEDCSTLMQRVQQYGGQASFLGIGTQLAAGHHNDHFDIDERSLSYGVIITAAIAWDCLGK